MTAAFGQDLALLSLRWPLMQPHPKLPLGGDGGSFFQGANNCTHFPIWVSQSAPHGGNVLGSFFLGHVLGAGSLGTCPCSQWATPGRLRAAWRWSSCGRAPPFHHDPRDQHHSMNSPPERDWHPPCGRFTHRKLQLCVITRGPVTNAFLVEYVSQSGSGCPLRVAKWSALS